MARKQSVILTVKEAKKRVVEATKALKAADKVHKTLTMENVKKENALFKKVVLPTEKALQEAKVDLSKAENAALNG